MKRLAIALAGVIAGAAALPQAAAAVPCEPASYEGPIRLVAPDRVAFGRAAAASVLPFTGWDESSSGVRDPVLRFHDADGSVLASREFTAGELAAAAAENPWDRRPLDIPVPASGGVVTARLTYAYRRYHNAPECDVVEEQAVRWFAGATPRFVVEGFGDGGAAYIRASCHELEPGRGTITVRYRSRRREFALCRDGAIRHLVLPGLRLSAGSALGGLTEGVGFRAVGWRTAVRHYAVEARWRGELVLRRWLRVAVRHFPGRRSVGYSVFSVRVLKEPPARS